MSHRANMEKLVGEFRGFLDTKRYDVLAVFLANYGPTLIDRGADLDRLYDENERLKAIVNLIEMAQERDALKDRVAELEAKLA